MRYAPSAPRALRHLHVPAGVARADAAHAGDARAGDARTSIRVTLMLGRLYEARR